MLYSPGLFIPAASSTPTFTMGKPKSSNSAKVSALSLSECVSGPVCLDQCACLYAV